MHAAPLAPGFGALEVESVAAQVYPTRIPVHTWDSFSKNFDFFPCSLVAVIIPSDLWF